MSAFTYSRMWPVCVMMSPELRRSALESIARAPDASLLGPLRASVVSETDPELKARKQRLNTLLTISYDVEEGETVPFHEPLVTLEAPD